MSLRMHNQETGTIWQRDQDEKLTRLPKEKVHFYNAIFNLWTANFCKNILQLIIKTGKIQMYNDCC